MSHMEIFKMWTSEELKLLNDITEDYTLEQVCTKAEIDIIGENSTGINNLRNAIFIPMHTLPVGNNS